MVCVSNSSLNNLKFIQLLSQKIYQSLQLGNVIPQDIYSIYSYFHLLVYGKPIRIVVHGTHLEITWDGESEENEF